MESSMGPSGSRLQVRNSNGLMGPCDLFWLLALGTMSCLMAAVTNNYAEDTYLNTLIVDAYM
jgi:hypothetical protein